MGLSPRRVVVAEAGTTPTSIRRGSTLWGGRRDVDGPDRVDPRPGGRLDPRHHRHRGWGGQRVAAAGAGVVSLPPPRL